MEDVPLRLAFAIRSVYDQLPSRDNLQKWGLVEDIKCGFCGGTETTCSAKAAKDLFLARGHHTPLQKEMSNSQARHSCRPRRDEALPSGSDRKWPDLVLMSSSTDAIVLVELTVPWEDRLQ